MLYRWRKPTCCTIGLYTKQAASHAPFFGKLFSAGLSPFFGGWRCALHGPGASAGDRGRTETPPVNLSACATCHYARKIGGRRGVRGALRGRRGVRGALRGRGCAARYAGGAMGTSRPTAITHGNFARGRGVHGALCGRRDGDIAPYRHYARKIRTRAGVTPLCGRGARHFTYAHYLWWARAGVCEDNCRHGASWDYSVSVTSPTSCLSFGFSSRSVSTCIFSVAVAQSV